MKGLKTGGRQKGTPNKLTAEARAICLALVRDPVYLMKFSQDFRDRKVPPGVESMVWGYAYGRPRMQLEVVHNEDGFNDDEIDVTPPRLPGGEK
jgi:hypothetical protein